MEGASRLLVWSCAFGGFVGFRVSAFLGCGLSYLWDFGETCVFLNCGVFRPL